MEKILEKFYANCFTLSSNDIFELNKNDNGPINNVISMVSRECFGVRLYDDKIGLTVEMFYLTNVNRLKGDILKLHLNDLDYHNLLLKFCVLLSTEYDDIDAINAYNIFQTQLRGFLQKSGFYTITNLELEQFKKKSASILGNAKRGIIKLELIDKKKFYRDYFNNIFNIQQIDNKDYVYLMLNESTSLIKIGTSKNPRYREKTLQSKEPSIYLIAKWCAEKNIEKELHKKYKKNRRRGEWFKLNLIELKEIEDYMNEIVNF